MIDGSSWRSRGAKDSTILLFFIDLWSYYHVFRLIQLFSIFFFSINRVKVDFTLLLINDFGFLGFLFGRFEDILWRKSHWSDAHWFSHFSCQMYTWNMSLFFGRIWPSVIDNCFIFANNWIRIIKFYLFFLLLYLW